MASDPNPREDIPIPPPPNRVPTSISISYTASSPIDAPLNAASLEPEESSQAAGVVAQSLQERVFERVYNRLEDELQNSIEEKAQVLGRPAALVQLKTVVRTDRESIRTQVFAQKDSSLRDVAQSTINFVLHMQEGRVQEVIQEYQVVVWDLIHHSQSMSREILEDALKGLENESNVISAESREHSERMQQKTPDPRSPELPSSATASTTARPESQIGPRYHFRTRPQPREERDKRTTGGRRAGDVKHNPPDSPTPKSKLEAGRQLGDTQENDLPPPMAAVREAFQEWSLKDYFKVADPLSDALIDSLDRHLGAVNELMNEQLRSIGGATHPTRSIRMEINTRKGARSFAYSSERDMRLQVSALCADILLEWVSNRQEAIDLLKLQHRGSKLVEEALLAVQRAKADFYSQIPLIPIEKRGRGTPSKHQEGDGLPTDPVIKATASSGESTE